VKSAWKVSWLYSWAPHLHYLTLLMYMIYHSITTCIYVYIFATFIKDIMADK
jgi:hypothetical protein